jgi:hypothetical protein
MTRVLPTSDDLTFSGLTALTSPRCHPRASARGPHAHPVCVGRGLNMQHRPFVQHPRTHCILGPRNKPEANTLGGMMREIADILERSIMQVLCGRAAITVLAGRRVHEPACVMHRVWERRLRLFSGLSANVSTAARWCITPAG